MTGRRINRWHDDAPAVVDSLSAQWVTALGVYVIAIAILLTAVLA